MRTRSVSRMSLLAAVAALIGAHAMASEGHRVSGGGAVFQTHCPFGTMETHPTVPLEAWDLRPGSQLVLAGDSR